MTDCICTNQLLETPVWLLTSADKDAMCEEHRTMAVTQYCDLKESGALDVYLANPAGTEFETFWDNQRKRWALKPVIEERKTMTTTATIDQLRPGAEYPDGNINARLHYTDAEIEELAASLRGPDGQLRPILVANHPKKPKLNFVFGGGRRRIAFERLISRGDLPKDHPIEIIDHGHLTVEEALSKSFADNQAVPMHPADQAVTFAKLSADKAPPEIAKDRGMTVRAVQQSISLGTSLSPTALAEWRAGTINREAVEVLVLGDFEQQDKILAEFKDSWQFKNGRGLDLKETRRQIMRNKEPEMRRYLGFVGLAAARANGVEVTEDFFGAGGVVKDMKPLKKLAKAKMDEIEAALSADGWSWVETRMAETFMHHGHGQTKVTPEYTAAEKKRLAEIATRLKAVQVSGDDDSYQEEAALDAEKDKIENDAEFRAYTDKQKAKSGVIVSITSTGAVSYQGGLIRREEPKAATSKPGSASTRAPAPPKIPDVDGDTERAMDAIKTAALAELIGAKPREAFAMFLASVAHGGWGSAISWQDLDNAASAIPGRNFAGAYEVLRKMTVDKLAAKLAVMVAEIADISGYQGNNKEAALIVEIVGEKNLQAGLAKRFDPKVYVRGASKQHLLGILAETEGEESRKANEKSNEATLALPVVTAIKSTGWLPPSLRTKAYAGPTAKKPAKAKPLKKAA